MKKGKLAFAGNGRVNMYLNMKLRWVNYLGSERPKRIIIR
jgi:hypothetical protein